MPEDSDFDTSAEWTEEDDRCLEEMIRKQLEEPDSLDCMPETETQETLELVESIRRKVNEQQDELLQWIRDLCQQDRLDDHGSEGDSHPLTDRGNALRIQDRFGDFIRYCTDKARWYYWDQGRWVEETTDMIHLKPLAIKIVDYLRSWGESTGNAKLAKFADACDKASRYKSIFEVAKALPGMCAESSAFDADQWLLNCPNGTIDLRTGDFRPHDRRDLMTKMIPVEYQPDAECPVWEATLESVFAGRAELVQYFHRIIGYGVTGDASEKAVFLLYGPGGNNGKSAVMNVVRGILGQDQYANQFDTKMLLSAGTSGGDKPRSDIAKLNGIRLAVGEELDGDKQVSNSLVKQLSSGSDTLITARNPHASSAITFLNTAKLFLSVNSEVRIEPEPAIYNRFHVIPYEVFYAPNQKAYDDALAQGRKDVQLADNTLQERLRGEYPGILRWIVQGCLTWQHEGLNAPQAALEAKDRYFGSIDIVGNFLDECCVLDIRASIRVDQLYQRYQTWCNGYGERPMSRSKLKAALVKKGIHQSDGESGGYRKLVGVRLRT